MKIPQNKLSCFLVNVVFGFICFYLLNLINKWISIFLWNGYTGSILAYVVLLVPIGIVTRYIWWGRVNPTQRIARGFKEAEASKKWDAVVEELRNRK